jgi:hypothetical protein
MPLLLAVAALVVLALLLPRRGAGNADMPARMVAAAANRLPTGRRDWGQAMIAELPEVRGRARRWLFTAGVVRVAVFPPMLRRTRVLVVLGVGILATAAATTAAAVQAPSLTVFACALGMSMCGCAAVMTSRAEQSQQRSAARLLAGAVALGGLAATIIVVVRVAVVHPSATIDHTHYVVTALFVLTLTSYLASALAPLRLGRDGDVAIWWALAATTAWILISRTGGAVLESPTSLIFLVGAATTLAAAVGAAVTTRHRAAGTKAGMLTVALSAPILFAINMTTVLSQRHYTLTDPYDISAFPHSGYPDVASYLISDALDGNIIAGLIVYPLALLVLAMLGAAIGTTLPNRGTRPTAPHITSG